MVRTTAAATDGGGPVRRADRRTVRLPDAAGRFLEAYALIGLLVVIAIFFSVWPRTSGSFASVANLQILIGNQAAIGIIALGALIPLIANEWDLSIGSVAGVTAVFTAAALSGGHGLLLSGLIGIGCGLVIGLANALIITRGRVNAVITTLGVSTILEGVVNQRTNGVAITTNIPDSVVNFGLGTTAGIPRVALVLIAVALLVYYVLDHTPWGRYLFALGSSPSAARLVGIRTGLVVGVAFVSASLLASVGGILQVARQAGADPRVGAAFTLPALAAAFLSAASVKPGKYNVGGTLVAILFLAVLNNGLSLAGVPAYVSSYLNGVALVVGVGLSAWLGRRRSERRRPVAEPQPAMNHPPLT
ncbi:ABC transporter permease [Actinomadura spongiicola]|uniref:ABC transporter permease n=1 Tax=Actinomadura spongiicola TaxID=2303421 RepID=A0A372GPQ4_9ACTN|nr:ABC transporter permease [Actinomadura spongiicola]RFS87388.1 ABC transporter permease [Actinomadura spongiicola]